MNAWTPEEDQKLIQLANSGLKSKEVYDGNFLPGRSRQAIAHQYLVLGIAGDRPSRWTNEEVWKAWFFNRIGYSVREIGDLLGRSKQSTSCKLSNERLYYVPPNRPIPEDMEIEYNNKQIQLTQEYVMEIERATGKMIV